MEDKPERSKRIPTTVRPYLGQSLLLAARQAFPSLDKVTDREFIEFCLMQAMNSRIQPVVDSTHFSANLQQPLPIPQSTHPITQDNQDDEPGNNTEAPIESPSETEDTEDQDSMFNLNPVEDNHRD